jgi:hypothetical protein
LPILKIGLREAAERKTGGMKIKKSPKGIKKIDKVGRGPRKRRVKGTRGIWKPGPSKPI